MSYIPTPTDESEPLGGRPAGSAAAEFRALKAHIKTQLAAIAASLATINGTLTTNGSSITAINAALNNFVFDDDLAVVHTTIISAAGAFTWNKPAVPEGDDWTDATAIFRLWGGGASGEACGLAAHAKDAVIAGGMGGAFFEFALPLSVVEASVSGSVGAGGLGIAAYYTDHRAGNAGGNTDITVGGVLYRAFGGQVRSTVGGSVFASAAAIRQLQRFPWREGQIGGRAIPYPRGVAGIPFYTQDGFDQIIGLHNTLLGGPAGGSLKLGVPTAAGSSAWGVSGGAAVVAAIGNAGGGVGSGGGAVTYNLPDSVVTSGAGFRGRVEIHIVRGKQRGYNTITVDL